MLKQTECPTRTNVNFLQIHPEIHQTGKLQKHPHIFRNVYFNLNSMTCVCFAKCTSHSKGWSVISVSFNTQAFLKHTHTHTHHGTQALPNLTQNIRFNCCEIWTQVRVKIGIKRVAFGVIKSNNSCSCS